MTYTDEQTKEEVNSNATQLYDVYCIAGFVGKEGQVSYTIRW